jgi:hypothetical protein
MGVGGLGLRYAHGRDKTRKREEVCVSTKESIRERGVAKDLRERERGGEMGREGILSDMVREGERGL